MILQEVRVRLAAGVFPLCLCFASCLSAQNAAAEAQTKLWSALKRSLLATNGQKYFELNLKGAVTPDGVYGVYFWRGVVRSTEPKNAPSHILVSLSESRDSEVLVRLVGTSGRAAWKTSIPPGSVVDFAVGIPEDFQSDPLLLTMDVPVEKFAVERLAK
jgi:hypothetical protein